eukprot:11570818-Alexandrium_andersonii.AAC.1
MSPTGCAVCRRRLQRWREQDPGFNLTCGWPSQGPLKGACPEIHGPPSRFRFAFSGVAPLSPDRTCPLHTPCPLWFPEEAAEGRNAPAAASSEGG